MSPQHKADESIGIYTSEEKIAYSLYFPILYISQSD